ncbi:hypothetical protein NP493_31g03001 [Ridgeia piscesae]|uniref:RING-type domain-containing protein n=1 Tax=Ridgeia piscesae TaxID=27915 RepID=A0AAD9PD23_RIDPI|nr:hypothetical protein NP493_31g03001 [Ridgeia piscesae]
MAYHGHRVRLYDNNVKSLNSAYMRIEEDKKYLHEQGLLLHKNFVGQILCLSRLEEAVRDVDLVIEAVIDDLQIKQELFERVSRSCSPNTVITSNTLRIDMSAAVERTENKARTVGLRFLYPVYCIPEVEITPNKYTSSETIEKVRMVLEQMGKTLFFRSGGQPLILNEEQREARVQARIEQVKSSCGLGNFFENTVPTLAHNGNVTPTSDNELVSFAEHEHDCAICMDRHRDCLLCPCHHMVTCSECAKSLLNRNDACPICRNDITEIIGCITRDILHLSQ